MATLRRILVVLALLGALAPRADAASRPRIVLGWVPSSVATAKTAQAPGLTHVSPLWYGVNPNGTLADRSDPAFGAWATARGINVWPLMGNGTDQDKSHMVLSNPAIRDALLDQAAASATRAHATGINIDWENLRDEDRDGFSAFVREAAARWHRAGLAVSVDLTVLTDTWSLGNWSTSMDRDAIGAAADYVVLMAYDEHNRLRPTGPTASLPWVEDSVKYLVARVPAAKIILGVPFYTRDWVDGQGATLTIAETPSRLASTQAQVQWDDRLALTYATYSKDGKQHQIWAEDERSLERKVALVDQYGLAGVAAWRMGFERAAAWRVLSGLPAPRPKPPATPVPTPSATPTATATPTPTPSPTPVLVHAAVAKPKPAPARRAIPAVATLALLAASAATIVRRRL